jgi:fission process protein 1
MVWGSRQPKDSKGSPSPDVDADADKPVARVKLSPNLQQLVDKEDDFYDDIYPS